MPYSILHRPAWQVLFREVELSCKHQSRRKKQWGRPLGHSDSLVLKPVLLTYLAGAKSETATLRSVE